MNAGTNQMRRLLLMDQLTPLEAPTSSIHANDPSAGSPTETLLRLLLPLNDKVQANSQAIVGSPRKGNLSRERPTPAEADHNHDGSLIQSFHRIIHR